MPSPKHLRNKPPQISISSWIMGGPIVTKSRYSRPRPVLVTTEPAKAPKAAEAMKSNDTKVENDNGKIEPKVPEEASESTEDAKSDAATVGSDAEKSDNESMWTPEQDALILKLKAENTSWKAIATKMSLAKSDIQARFKELQKKGAETLATSTADSDGKGEDGENGNEEKNEVTQNADKEGDEDGGAHGGRLKPDDSWSREDCEILEMLEARYREQKWLSMQASFYNLTGRMIRADIIERKLSEARS